MNYSSNFYLKIIIPFLIIISINSCKNSSEDDISYSIDKPTIRIDSTLFYPIIEKQVPYKNREVPHNLSDIIYYSTESYDNLHDTVILFVEGGPNHLVVEKGSYIVSQSIKNVYNKKKLSIMSLRQMHNLNLSVFGSGDSFTSENAQEVNQETLDMIERVVGHLKSNNKVVYLYGHSNGSLIVQNYIINNKLSADGYVISGTRLAIDERIVNIYKNDTDYHFENGTIFKPFSLKAQDMPYFNVLRLLQIDNYKDFTTLLLNNKNLFTKIIYCLGKQDEALGAISEKEKKFLDDNNIKYVFKDGNHADTSAMAILDGFKYLFSEKN